MKTRIFLCNPLARIAFSTLALLSVSMNCDVVLGQGHQPTPTIQLTWNSVDPEENHIGLTVGDTITYGASVDVKNRNRFIVEARLDVSVYRRGTLPDGSLGWLEDAVASIDPPDSDLIAPNATETLSNSSTFVPTEPGIYKVTATVSSRWAEDGLDDSWVWQAGNHHTHIFSVAPDE